MQLIQPLPNDLQEYAEPGIHVGLDAEVYHALPYCSNSRLSALVKSGKHLKDSLNASFDLTTSAVRMGSALDTLLLEPEHWPGWTVLAEGEKYNTGEGLRKKKEHVSNYSEKHFKRHSLNAKEWTTVQAMKKALSEHEKANRLLTTGNDSMNQVSISFVWNDVMVKGRLDRLIFTHLESIGVDLKTINDASPRSIQRAIYERGYHRQAVLYMLGCKILGKPLDSFKFIFVENQPPYTVQVKELSSTFIHVAVMELEPLIERFKYCVKNDYYPEYTNEETVEPPPWALDIDYKKRYLSDIPTYQLKAA